MYISGAGIAQWLERRTRDQKVAGSNFLLRGQLFSVLILICVSIPPSIHSTHLCCCSSTYKIPVILPKARVAGYSSTHMQHTYIYIYI